MSTPVSGRVYEAVRRRTVEQISDKIGSSFIMSYKENSMLVQIGAGATGASLEIAWSRSPSSPNQSNR